MISFTCPTCSKGYTAPDHHAGQKGKCKQCQEPLVVPAVNDPRWWKTEPAPAGTVEQTKAATDPGMVVPDEAPVVVGADRPKLQTAEEGLPPAPPANATPPSAPPPGPAGQFPEFFESTRRAGDLLESVAAAAIFLGCAASFVGVVWAMSAKQPGLAAGLFVGALLCLLSIPVFQLVIGSTRVLLDIAQSLRVLRAREEVSAS